MGNNNPLIMEQLAENMFLSFKSSGLFKINDNNLRSSVNVERNLPELHCFADEDGDTATCKLCQYKSGEYLCTISTCPIVDDDVVSPVDCSCKVIVGDGQCTSCSYCDENWFSSYDCTNLNQRYGSQTCDSNNITDTENSNVFGN